MSLKKRVLEGFPRRSVPAMNIATIHIAVSLVFEIKLAVSKERILEEIFIRCEGCIPGSRESVLSGF